MAGGSSSTEELISALSELATAVEGWSGNVTEMKSEFDKGTAEVDNLLAGTNQSTYDEITGAFEDAQKTLDDTIEQLNEVVQKCRDHASTI